MTIASLLQSSAASEMYDAWRSRIISIEQVDAAAARRAVHALYDAMHLARPDAVLVMESPLQAALVLRALTTAGITTAGDDGRLLTERLAAVLAAAPQGGVGASVRALSEQILMVPIRAALQDHDLVAPSRTDRSAVAAIMRSQAGLDIRPLWHRAGSVRLAWKPFDLSASIAALAQLAFWRESFSPLLSSTSTPIVSALTDVCCTCGWAVLLEKVAVVSDRPVAISVSSLTMQSPKSGAVHVYRDGYEIRAHQGVLLPAWLIASPNRVTVGHIERENNIEMRRLLLEAMGVQRYLRKSKAKKIAQDDAGILWQRVLSTREREWRPELQPMTFVEVINGTPDPDGSCRRYFLRVPPWVRTAREGVGWTYGLSEAEYRPTLRT